MSLLNISKTYKPFIYPWAVEMTKKHEEIHWIEDEAELSEDVQDWRTKLSESEKEFITQVLRLFTQSDVQVGENYHEFLIPKFKNNEIRNMLSSFATREGVHQRAYALLNDTLGLPDEEYHAFLEYKAMADKIDFMSHGDTSSHTGLALALAQSVFNEGMSLFASFVMLLNFQRFGKMKGMGKVPKSEGGTGPAYDPAFIVFTEVDKTDAGDNMAPRTVQGHYKTKWYAKKNNTNSVPDSWLAGENPPHLALFSEVDTDECMV